MSSRDVPQKAALRPAQVFATTMAAVSGAFLASRLGVYGTVVGAGVLSAFSTVGAELYLRSLERTKAVAARSVSLRPELSATSAATAETVQLNAAPTTPDTTLPIHVATDHANEPTHHGPGTTDTFDETTEARRTWQRLPWRAISATTAATFVLAMAAITGFEAMSGGNLSGGSKSTIVDIAGRPWAGSGGSDSADDTADDGSGDGTPNDDTTDDDAEPAEPSGGDTADRESSGEPGDRGATGPTSEFTDEPTTEPSDEPTDEVVPEPTENPTSAPSESPAPSDDESNDPTSEATVP